MERLNGLLIHLLPRIKAEACADYWWDYRCLTAGACKVWQRRRMCCCPLRAVSSWQSIGCCGGSCC